MPTTALIDANESSTPVSTELQDYRDYATQYRLFTKQTAESVLRLAMLLVQAYKKLPPESHALFCEDIGLDPEDSKYKKLYRIGEAATRLLPYVHALPNSWTTMYLLARLEAEQLELLVKQGQLSSMMTAKEIVQAVGKKEGGKPREAQKVIKIKFNAHAAEEQIRHVIEMLEALKDTIPLKIERDGHL